jgi:hypothetical protein
MRSSLADLALSLLEHSIIGAAIGPLTFEALLARGREVITQAASRWASTLSSRESSSSDSPHSNLRTASVFFPAHQGGCDRWSLPCSLWLFTVMRVIFTLAYPCPTQQGAMDSWHDASKLFGWLQESAAPGIRRPPMIWLVRIGVGIRR